MHLLLGSSQPNHQKKKNSLLENDYPLNNIFFLTIIRIFNCNFNL
jgi:hypothetical protein